MKTEKNESHTRKIMLNRTETRTKQNQNHIC